MRHWLRGISRNTEILGGIHKVAIFVVVGMRDVRASVDLGFCEGESYVRVVIARTRANWDLLLSPLAYCHFGWQISKCSEMGVIWSRSWLSIHKLASLRGFISAEPDFWTSLAYVFISLIYFISSWSRSILGLELVFAADYFAVIGVRPECFEMPIIVCSSSFFNWQSSAGLSFLEMRFRHQHRSHSCFEQLSSLLDVVSPGWRILVWLFLSSCAINSSVGKSLSKWLLVVIWAGTRFLDGELSVGRNFSQCRSTN